MKVRGQRTHYTGASNRDVSSFNNTNNKTQSVFERSFIKSKSLYNNTLMETSTFNQDSPLKSNRVNPFLGTHNQFQTQRFDKTNVIPYKYQKMQIPHGRRTITFAPHLNSQVKNIQYQFDNKKINMHKLNQLKRAFVKNNRQRRNLQSYFGKFEQGGVVDVSSLKKIVKEYGFDVNQDEAKLIFRLTNKSAGLDVQQDHINKQAFIQLMTRDDVFYNTLQISQNLSQPNNQSQNHFSQKVHQILRNKFPKLKQAFKIYRQRNEKIKKKQYDYVMKKLDLTDLVISQEEREKIYKDYCDQEGEFNVQGLVCAIAQQEFKNRNLYTTDFIQDLNVNKQAQFNRSRKVRGYQLKNLSNLQYQNQYHKAKQVINQLKKLKIKRKQNNKQTNLYEEVLNNEFTDRQQFLKATQKILKNEGVNFQKQDYDALGAYLNYDVNGNIPMQKVNHILFNQSQKDAQQRFQRKLRNEAPKNIKKIGQNQHDQAAATDSIIKLKASKMNPQTKQLFKFFDSDKDGYVSANQFKQKVKQLNVMQNWEIQNLANFLKVNQEGSINFKDFSKRINEDVRKIEKELPLVRSQNSKSCYDWLQTTNNRKKFINNANQSCYQRPTKFSAWPSNIIYQDLTLVQPPQNAGMYSSEAQRFGQRKQDYGMKQKLAVLAVADARRRKIAQWNNILNQRQEINKQKQQQKAAARNYALRLTKQKYQFNCHQ